MFSFDGEDDLGRAPPPKYAFTCDTPLRQPKPKSKCEPAGGLFLAWISSRTLQLVFGFPDAPNGRTRRTCVCFGG